MRSFAAPVQAKPKPRADAASGPRINEAITAAYIRLVSDEGHGIISRREALDHAKKLKLDLVEVQRTANPPVCKIMDFHKEKYLQEQKEKERAKSKSALTLRSGENKEVRFKAKTELKDLKIKAETVTRLMERGYRVKCTALPTGKEEEGLGVLLARLLALIEDASVVESGPHVDAKQAYVIVRHVKFATKKCGKKVSEIVDAVSRGVRTAFPNTPAAVSSISQDEMPVQGEEEWEPIECSSGDEREVSSDQVEENIQHRDKMGWSGFNSTDNFEDIFNFDAEGNTVNSNFSGGSHTPKDANSSKQLHQKVPAISVGGGIPASKPGLALQGGKLEFKKEPTDMKITAGFASSQREPSVGESNRYSKRSEAKGRFQHSKPMERNNTVTDNRAVSDQVKIPQQPTGNERNWRGQLDPKQKQFHPSNPSSSSPSYRIYSSPNIGGSGNQSRSEGATMGKPSDPRMPSQSYGIFNAPKTTDSGDQKNSGDATTGKPSNPTSPPTYGIFSNPKTFPPGDQSNLGDATAGKPRGPSSSSPSYGIFSATKPGVSSDERNLGGTSLGKPGRVGPSSS